jgi:hypothetical protein
LKKQTTRTPSQTVVMTELERLPWGNMARGNIANLHHPQDKAK